MAAKGSGEVSRRRSVTCPTDAALASSPLACSASLARLPLRSLAARIRSLDRNRGLEGCCHAGYAPPRFLPARFRRRTRRNVRASSVARPAPWFAIMSRNTPPLPPRRGRVVTAPARPRSRQRGTVSGALLPKPQRRLAGPRNNHPQIVLRSVALRRLPLHVPSVPNPKFVLPCSTPFYELRIRKDTRNP
jgi:hypothetical protein